MKTKPGIITRRSFVEAMAATGIATGTGLLAGCASPRAAQDEAPTESAPAESTSAEPTATESTDTEASTPTQASGNSIVTVFSWSGNTLTVANRIAEDLQSELFRIEPATPYTDDYDEMLQIAQDEQAADALPELASSVSEWGAYTTVYLGFPTWWGHLPQIVKTFLGAHDCTGKVVYPFNTHGGSGFASCLSDLTETCPGADVREGLSLLGDGVSSNLDQVDAWVSAGEQ